MRPFSISLRAGGGDPCDYRLPDRTPIDPSLYDGALPTELIAPLARLRTDPLPTRRDDLGHEAALAAGRRTGDVVER
jgi:hypothetical protein